MTQVNLVAAAIAMLGLGGLAMAIGPPRCSTPPPANNQPGGDAAQCEVYCVETRCEILCEYPEIVSICGKCDYFCASGECGFGCEECDIGIE